MREATFVQLFLALRGELTEDHTQRVGLDSIGRLLGRDDWRTKQAAQQNVGNFSPPAEEKMKIISERSKIRTTMYRNHVIISRLRGRKPTLVNWNISGGIF